MEHLSNDLTKTIPISARIVRSYSMKLFSNIKSMETETKKHDQNFPMKGKPL